MRVMQFRIFMEFNKKLFLMEKKDLISSSWQGQKSQNPRQEGVSFKVRSTLYSKDKQNKIEKTIQNAKAKNIITKSQLFNSPQLIFALNESIREQTGLDYESKSGEYFRDNHLENKTFHFNSTYNKVNTLPQLPAKNSSKHKYYALNEERDKALELSRWVSEKLQGLKSKKVASLEDILEYNQTITNYALGQIIQSVRKRCKQEGDTLKFIWDTTFVLFENLLNVLAEEVNKKDQELVNSQKELQKIYKANLEHLKNKNDEMKKHLDMLYERMKKIIQWNRSLRKDLVRQQIKYRMLEYRQASFADALEEATGMLLAESTEPNILKFAKKIISALYKQKQLKGSKNLDKMKDMQKDALQYVHQNAKDYVISWLKQHSIQDDEKIKNQVYLSQDEKIQILKLSDKERAQKVNIYDYFKTVNTGMQVDLWVADASTQCSLEEKKTRTIAVETRKVYTSTAMIQVKIEDKEEQDVKINKNRSRKKINLLDNKSKNPNSLNKNNVSKSKKKIPLGNLSTINNKQNKGNRKNSYEDERQLLENDIKQASKLKNKQRLSKVSMLRRPSELKSQFSQLVSVFKKQNRSAKSIIDSKDEQDFDSSNSQSNKGERYTARTLKDLIDEEEEEISVAGGGYKKAKNGTKMGSYKTLNVNNIQNNAKSMDKFGQNNYYYLGQGNNYYKKSQRISSEPNDDIIPVTSYSYKTKALQRKKFMETYQTQMKEQVEKNKEQIIRNVIRRRSFYKPSNARNEVNEKQIMFLWYKPVNNNKYILKPPLRQFNQIDQNIYSYFTNLSKNINLPLNFSKSKTFNQTCSLFSSVSNTLSTVQRAVPKNKQFIILTVGSITKFISRLIVDYLRKIKGEAEEINIELDKVYYPLSVILVDHMMHKYGLRDIAQKKLRNFMEKMATFVGVSERISFFYRLFGIGEQLVGADELLIYMKCLVYFDITKTVSVMSMNKDFSVDRAITDKDTVLANVDKIINQFFPESMREQAKWRIQRYFCLYQVPGQFEIEKIAALLIDEFLSRKKQMQEHYVPIYRNCRGNFFPNLFKSMEVFCQAESLPQSHTKMINQIFKNADLIDQNYGKSISQLRFLGLCVKLGFPIYKQIRQKMQKSKKSFIQTTGTSQSFTTQGDEYINKIKRKYNIKISIQKDVPDYWLWTCAQIGHEVPLINSCNLLGNLRHFKNSNNL